MIPRVLQDDDPRVPAAVLEAIETGQTIIFPTDTIYGIGGNPWDDSVVGKVRALKGRSADQPFTLHVPSVGDLDRYADISERIRPTVARLLPGPYTLILPARSGAPSCSVVAGSVGVRVPLHAFFSAIAGLGRPLFGTSVNAHGEEPLGEVNEIIDRFPSVDLIVVGTVSGRASDILDLTAEPPRALRGSLPSGLWVSPLSRDG